MRLAAVFKVKQVCWFVCLYINHYNLTVTRLVWNVRSLYLIKLHQKWPLRCDVIQVI